ncbi:MAG: SDR family oxidoreductase, partial [Acidobacteriota bacterium]
LDAARREGVRRFVYVSATAGLRENCELVRIKRLVEREVRGSGLEWVVLQPTAFLDVWISPMLGWDLAGGRARIIGRGDRPVSFMAVRDVARVAAEAARTSQFCRQDVPIGGPEALAPNDVLRLAEEITGRTFRVERPPLPLLKLVRAVLSPFAPLPASLLSMGIQMAERGDVIDSSALWRRLGHTPETVRGFLEKAAAASSAASPNARPTPGPAA